MPKFKVVIEQTVTKTDWMVYEVEAANTAEANTTVCAAWDAMTRDEGPEGMLLIHGEVYSRPDAEAADPPKDSTNGLYIGPPREEHAKTIVQEAWKPVTIHLGPGGRIIPSPAALAFRQRKGLV